MYVIRLPKKGDVVTAIKNFTQNEVKWTAGHKKVRVVRIRKGQKLEIVNGIGLFAEGTVCLRVFSRDKLFTFGVQFDRRKRNVNLNVDEFSGGFSMPGRDKKVDAKKLDQAYKDGTPQRKKIFRDVEL